MRLALAILAVAVVGCSKTHVMPGTVTPDAAGTTGIVVEDIYYVTRDRPYNIKGCLSPDGQIEGTIRNDSDVVYAAVLVYVRRSDGTGWMGKLEPTGPSGVVALGPEERREFSLPTSDGRSSRDMCDEADWDGLVVDRVIGHPAP